MKFILFAISFLPCLLFAQNNSLVPKKIEVKIQSPEVSNLGKFGEIPIGKFTGTSDISVPIYTLKIGDFELPITLRYHTGGIQVEEIATNAGLGWVLDAGGVITRTVNGLNDFAPMSGYLNTPYRLNNPIINEVVCNLDSLGATAPGGYEYFIAKKIANGEVDTQPDVFSYSFPGQSGKFYYDQNLQIHPFPFNAFKYQCIGDFAFKIVDTKGVQYFYTQVEEVASGGFCGESIQGSSYLSKIKFVNNDSIIFNYDTLSYEYDMNGSYSRAHLIPGNSSVGTYLVSQNLDCYGGPSLIQTRIKSQRIKNIIASNGSMVEFQYDQPREDLLNTKMLSSIQVKYLNTTLNSFQLHHSYFYTEHPSICISPNQKRLKLDSVTQLNNFSYSFSYNENVLLPNRLSKAKDHYGYFNGTLNNQTLLPIDYENGFTDGADREINPNYVQACILNSITYPTGGKSIIQYESNDYRYTGIEKTFFPKSHFLAGAPNITTTKNFTIPDNPISIINAKVIFIANPLEPILSNSINELPAGSEILCTIIIQSNTGFYQEWSNQNTSNAGFGLGNLPPGDYTITITTKGDYENTYAVVDYQEMLATDVDKNKLTGGVRVKKIDNYTDNSLNNPLTKYFKYLEENSVYSSGRISFAPTYLSKITYTVTIPIYNVSMGTIADYEFTYHDYWKQLDNPFLPLASIHGNTVGYTRVEEYSSGIENGKVVSKFSFDTDYGGSLTYPMVPTISRDWFNGLLQEETTFKNIGNNFIPVLQKKNFYSSRHESEFWNSHYGPSTYNYDDYMRGYGLNLEYVHLEYWIFLRIIPAKFRWNDYHLVSKWVRLDSSLTTIYDQNNSSLALIESEKYSYSNPYNLLPTVIQKINSKKDIQFINKKYPNDFIGNLNGASSVAKQSLINENRIDITLEEESKIGQNPIIKYSYLHENFYNSPNLRTVQKTTFNGFIENEVQVNLYDFKKNILEFTPKDGIINSYIYAYNNTYPVAKIIGSTYNNAISQSNINLTYLNSLTDDNAIRIELNKLRNIPNAFVTTYTYKPLVGITSETDANGKTTYYEYDSFNRLKHIKDKDGNVLKVYDYKYKATPNQ